MTKRISSGDVTETLIAATEAAGEMNAEFVVVLLYRKSGEVAKLKPIFSDDVTIETANWMLDKTKHFLIQE